MKPVRPTLEMVEFAEEISAKLYDRYQGKIFDVSSLADAVRQMIEHKLANEYWSRSNLKIESRSTQVRNDA